MENFFLTLFFSHPLKAIFSRVARVCKWDKGGPHRFRNRWTTFLKSRLNCSVPGDYPFYFNEIRKFFLSFSAWSRKTKVWFPTESTSDLVEGAYGNTNSRLIYGVFTTPDNAIAGSAICAFALQVKLFAKFEFIPHEANTKHREHERWVKLLSTRLFFVFFAAVSSPQIFCLWRKIILNGKFWVPLRRIEI